MKETANRGKGPICSCGIGELSLATTEEQAEAPEGKAETQAPGSPVTPDGEQGPVEEERHEA